MKLLDQAGYTKVVGGVRENSAGQKLSFALTNNGGYSDWVADATVIAQQLVKVGIQITHRNVSGPTTSENMTGHFQIGSPTRQAAPVRSTSSVSGCTPGPRHRQDAQLHPVERDPATNALFNAYGITNNPTVQHAIVFKLQKVMLSQVPYIPVLGAVSWDQYSTAQFTGWPTPQTRTRRARPPTPTGDGTCSTSSPPRHRLGQPVVTTVQIPVPLPPRPPLTVGPQRRGTACAV